MQLKTEIASFEIIPPGILQVTFFKGQEEIDLEEAKRHVAIGNELTGGKALPVLVDATESLHQLTKEAKNYIADFAFKKAEAILVKELHQRIIATFYLKLSGKVNQHPTKVFNNRDSAVAWLQSYL